MMEALVQFSEVCIAAIFKVHQISFPSQTVLGGSSVADSSEVRACYMTEWNPGSFLSDKTALLPIQRHGGFPVSLQDCFFAGEVASAAPFSLKGECQAGEATPTLALSVVPRSLPVLASLWGIGTIP